MTIAGYQALNSGEVIRDKLGVNDQMQSAGCKSACPDSSDSRKQWQINLFTKVSFFFCPHD